MQTTFLTTRRRNTRGACRYSSAKSHAGTTCELNYMLEQRSLVTLVCTWMIEASCLRGAQRLRYAFHLDGHLSYVEIQPQHCSHPSYIMYKDRPPKPDTTISSYLRAVWMALEPWLPRAVIVHHIHHVHDHYCINVPMHGRMLKPSDARTCTCKMITSVSKRTIKRSLMSVYVP